MGIQVYSATHSGEGNPLSVLGRHFISFSYGGKNIEDFNLLACFSGDRLNKGVYAPFQDVTTQQTELDGQMFWSSSYSAGTLTFFLATDGMTVKEYEDFKAWFSMDKSGRKGQDLQASIPQGWSTVTFSLQPFSCMKSFCFRKTTLYPTIVIDDIYFQ